MSSPCETFLAGEGDGKFDHGSLQWTDDTQKWVSRACLHKNPWLR